MKKITSFLIFCTLIFVIQSSAVYSAKYYWVNGTGDWDQLAHWATISGGTIMHVQIPTANDTVYFDANSFTATGQTVTLNTTTALCHTMDWTGAQFNPSLSGPASNILKIYGSLTVILNMNIPYDGNINFEATATGQTIKTNGKALGNDFYFNGSGGGWMLLDSLTLNGKSIYFNYGSFNTNNQNINCYTFNATQTNPRTLTLGSSVITLSYAYGNSAFQLYTSNMTVNCGTSKLRFIGGSGTNAGGMFVYDGYNNQTVTLYDAEFLYASGTAPLNASGTTNLFMHNVIFSGNGTINGNITYANLSFASGKSYLLENGKTQTIQASFTIGGASGCAAVTSIQSSTNGSFATMSKSGGNVTVAFVALRDVHAVGGAVFTANNSTDLGNNTGWIINTATSLDLYWVGGTGNWDDQNHWSFSSGGPGGACIPSSNDDVFFDANSFSATGQTCTINISNAVCRTMDWTGALYNPTFAGPGTNVLKIYGSLTFIYNMNIPFNGNINFEATVLGNTIKTNGNQLINDFYFMGSGGGWTLLDSLTLNGKSIYFNYGSLNTGSQNVYCYTFNATQTNPRVLTLGASVITLSYAYGNSAFQLYTSNMTVNGGTSKLRFIGGSGTNAGGMFVYDGYNNQTVTLYDAEFLYGPGTAPLNASGTTNLIMHDVSFIGNGNINGNITYQNLSFYGGKMYLLENGKIQTIINSFAIAGPVGCMNLTLIQSSTNGSFASMSKSAGNITVDYVILRDVHAVGGAVFTANNSTDLGNNTGWIINPVAPRTLYWVGGTGNWDQQAHWSLSSGGAGGQCIPTPDDDVFFDAGSFSGTGQTCTINLSNATCRSMDWTGAQYNPSFAGPGTNVLKIYGSLTLIFNMNIPFDGNINFESTTTGKTIKTNGKTLTNDLYFMGSGGGWTLQDSLTLNGKSIYFNYGSFNTNNYNINCYTFNATQTNPRTLTLGSSVITLTYAYGNSAFQIYTSNMTVNGGTSKLKFIGGSGTNAGGMFVYDGYNNQTVSLYDAEFLYPAGVAPLSASGTTNLLMHNVTFTGSGTINGNISYNDLNFTAGHTYILENGKTQTIADHWRIQGTCTSYIILQSSTNGTFATVNKTSGAVIGFNLHIRDIHCIGGASFNAYNSVDLGGNSGWNFAVLPNMGNIFGVTGPPTLCIGQTGVDYWIAPVTGAISYIWTVPSGMVITYGQGDTLIIVDAIGADSGNVSVIASNGCGFSSPSSLPVTISAVPIADAGLPQTVCPGGSATLVATGGVSYLWSNGVTTDSTIVNPAGATTYYVTVSNACGASAIDSVTISVSALPSADAGLPQTICSGSTANLTATGGGAYLWNNGDTSSTTSVNPVVSTMYYVTVTNACGGNANDSVKVFVAPLPVADAGLPQSVCPGTTAALTATGGVNYAWSNGGLTATINVSPTANTTYYVTVTDSCGIPANDSVTVTVGTLPVADAGLPQSICPGASATLIATGGSAYLWSNGATTDTITITPSATATYFVTVSNTCGGSAMDSVTVNVGQNPVADAGLPQTLCAGASITLTATGGGSYLWSTGDTVAVINVNPAITTTFYVSVSNSCGGNAVDSVLITVIPAPFADAGQHQSICTGGSATLIATGGGPYVWSTGDTTAIITVSPTATTIYSLTVTNSCGAVATDTVSVSVGLPTVADAGLPQNICFGDTAILSATGGGAYSWSTGEITSIIAVKPATTTMFYVSVSNSCGGTVTDSVLITVSPLPVADAGMSQTIDIGQSITLNATGGINYSWTPPTYLDNPDIANPVSAPVKNITYTVNVTNANGCSASDAVTIIVNDAGTVFIPNAFTPDNDGNNDVLFVEGIGIKELDMAVYNRWGEMIFQTNELGKDNGWDGTYMGKNLPSAVFVCHIKVKLLNGNEVNKIGDITLMR